MRAVGDQARLSVLVFGVVVACACVAVQAGTSFSDPLYDKDASGSVVAKLGSEVDGLSSPPPTGKNERSALGKSISFFVCVVVMDRGLDVAVAETDAEIDSG